MSQQSSETSDTASPAGKEDVRDLGNKTVGGGFAAAFMQVGTTVVNLAGLAVLARIVAQEDFGLLAKVMCVTGVFALIGDMGLSLATIQRKELSHEKLSALFWVNVVLAGAVALITALVAPLIARFYGDDRVILIALGLGLNAAVVGLGAQHLALLKRKLRFFPIAIIQISAILIGYVVAISSAVFLGFGYWALLLQLISVSILKTLGFWAMAGWVPSRPRRDTDIRSELKMGGNFTAFTFVNYFVRNGDNILIAKFFGDFAVGLYSKAYGLLLTPSRQLSTPIAQVAVPALSRLQGKPDEFREFFRKGVAIAMVLQVPVSAFAAVAGADIIMVFLGPGWEGSIPIFYGLIPSLLVSTTAPATQWVVIATGDTGRLLKVGLFSSAFVLCSFFVGIPYGAVGVAWAYSIASCIARVPAILFCLKPSPVSASDFFPFMIVPFACAGAAGGACLLAALPFSDGSAWITLVVKMVSFGAVYIACVSFSSAGKETIDRVKRQLERIRHRFTQKAVAA